jgi:hypothetical protein
MPRHHLHLPPPRRPKSRRDLFTPGKQVPLAVIAIRHLYANPPFSSPSTPLSEDEYYTDEDDDEGRKAMGEEGDRCRVFITLHRCFLLAISLRLYLNVVAVGFPELTTTSVTAIFATSNDKSATQQRQDNHDNNNNNNNNNIGSSSSSDRNNNYMY